ncbi:MAG: TerB family tellurite resistance protein [Piscinibacter sp.]|nr:TerB family tellurite resistance protein [Piscinibacter sp.]
MTRTNAHSASEAAARVLAVMVAANGHIDPRELQVLDDLEAYARLGVGRERFAVLVRECLDEVGIGLAECSWLRAGDQAYVDALLEAVPDPRQRLLLCRLAAAVVTADGHVSSDERLVYDHALAYWHISRSMVTEAILQDGGSRRRVARPAH